jgi:hypothetical protein
MTGAELPVGERTVLAGRYPVIIEHGADDCRLTLLAHNGTRSLASLLPRLRPVLRTADVECGDMMGQGLELIELQDRTVKRRPIPQVTPRQRLPRKPQMLAPLSAPCDRRIVEDQDQ